MEIRFQMSLRAYCTFESQSLRSPISSSTSFSHSVNSFVALKQAMYFSETDDAIGVFMWHVGRQNKLRHAIRSVDSTNHKEVTRSVTR